jgi:hypothetical protein
MNLEESAQRVLALLAAAFPGIPLASMPGRISRVPLGIEIEIPWSAYHPKLWREYFQGGKIAHEELSSERRDQLYALCVKEEEMLLPKIKKAEKCMQIFQGRRYWEYCFPPTCDTSILLGICHALASAGLCIFNGPHRMQITIGGVVPTQHAYCALMYLELKYGSKGRMLHGMKDQGWAIKGQAGILHKNKYDLHFGYKDGIEFRPLVLPPTIEGLGTLLYDCSLLADALHAKQVRCEDHPIAFFCAQMSRLLREHNLPFKRWQNPEEEKEVWLRFIREFDSMKASLLELSQYGFA